MTKRRGKKKGHRSYYRCHDITHGNRKNDHNNNSKSDNNNTNNSNNNHNCHENITRVKNFL